MPNMKSPFPTPDAPSDLTTDTPDRETPTNQAAPPPPSNPFGRPGGDDDFVINLEGVDLNASGGQTYLPPDDYLFYVTNVEKTMSRAGNSMIVWYLQVYQGEYKGKTLRFYTVLTPNSMFNFVRTCEAVGFSLEGRKGVSVGELKTHAVKTLVWGRVIDGDNEGRKTSNIQFLAAPTEGAGTKIPAAGVPA